MYHSFFFFFCILKVYFSVKEFKYITSSHFVTFDYHHITIIVIIDAPSKHSNLFDLNLFIHL
jgi:hypothetical protein